MTKLKLGAVPDDKPVRLSLDLPAQLHRDLMLYAEILGRETGQTVEPPKLIPHMLARFIASDRAFAKVRRGGSKTEGVLTATPQGRGPA